MDSTENRECIRLLTNSPIVFQVLDHAMNGPDGKDNCSKFVDILGLRTIFPLFMKTPTKNRKKMLTAEEHEGDEHNLQMF